MHVFISFDAGTKNKYEKKNPFYLCSALIGLLYGVAVHRGGEKKMQGVTKEEEEEKKCLTIGRHFCYFSFG